MEKTDIAILIVEDVELAKSILDQHFNKEKVSACFLVKKEDRQRVVDAIDGI